MAGLPDPLLKHLAERDGVSTRRAVRDLLEITHGTVDGWLRRGLLRSNGRGVIVLAGLALTPQREIRSAIGRAGTGARAGAWSSLALLGVEGFALTAEEVPDVVVPPHRWVDGATFGQSAIELAREDRRIIDGIPGLSATRALLELAAVIDERRLRVGVDSADRRGELSRALLRKRAMALRSHTGAALIRRLGRAGVLDLESEGERRLLPLLADFDPQPETQVTDLVKGRRLDFAWRAIRYGLEYDSKDHHTLPTDRDADGLRDLECGSAGVLVHRITAGMLRYSLTATLRGVRATFDRRWEALRAGRLD